MKKLMKLFVLVVLVGGVLQPVFAASVNAGGGKKSVARMLDSSGGPIGFNDDKPWKVFEVAYTTTPAQIVDEAGVAPKQGMIKRVCVESAPAIAAAVDNAILWDTVTAADMSANVVNRRLAPPIQRVSGVEKCVELHALFTSGAGVKNGASTGSTYVYWRELGGYR